MPLRRSPLGRCQSPYARVAVLCSDAPSLVATALVVAPITSWTAFRVVVDSSWALPVLLIGVTRLGSDLFLQTSEQSVWHAGLATHEPCFAPAKALFVIALVDLLTRLSWLPMRWCRAGVSERHLLEPLRAKADEWALNCCARSRCICGFINREMALAARSRTNTPRWQPA